MYTAKTVLLRVYPYRCNELETVIIFIKSVREITFSSNQVTTRNTRKHFATLTLHISHSISFSKK